ncbi:MAG: phosphonopyruvate decarboxylase [Candidatus Methanomethylophilaceae archaeon]|nr:phosphonopyruvate decarboxylase [Candidatus Methanomethylophilaceae archaeon]
MVSPEEFYGMLNGMGVGFYTGVPDSLLKQFCAYVTDVAPRENHIIAANEGCAVGLAAGYHIATGGIPLVYMQNSGLGNATNPLLSLADELVYRIPMVLLIGWRGEPGVHDEPQHAKQGRATCTLLEAMGIPYEVVSGDVEECTDALDRCRRHLETNGSPFAIVVRKGTFSEYVPVKKREETPYPLVREEAISEVVATMPDALFVSTTGMASRELYELREARGEGHDRDFLTVGSMGHASQIALGMALSLPGTDIVCIDGDGAALMHMGGMSTIASQSPRNLCHVVINNGVHDSVGGQPTVSREVDLEGVARSLGYRTAVTVRTPEEIRDALTGSERPAFVQIMVRRGHRKDLGRPATTPEENKRALMGRIREDSQ